MPRFTIGSLMTGLVIALVVIVLLQNWSGSIAARGAVASGNVAPPGGGPQPLAVDPIRGRVLLGQEKANDNELQDGADWTGGMDAAGW